MTPAVLCSAMRLPACAGGIVEVPKVCLPLIVTGAGGSFGTLPSAPYKGGGDDTAEVREVLSARWVSSAQPLSALGAWEWWQNACGVPVPVQVKKRKLGDGKSGRGGKKPGA